VPALDPAQPGELVGIGNISLGRCRLQLGDQIGLVEMGASGRSTGTLLQPISAAVRGAFARFVIGLTHSAGQTIRQDDPVGLGAVVVFSRRDIASRTVEMHMQRHVDILPPDEPRDSSGKSGLGIPGR